MSTTRERLARLAEPFTDLDLRPDVWCERCVKKSCLAHDQGLCSVCDQFTTEAHDHYPYVSHLALRQRFNEVDPTWSLKPIKHPDTGLPMIVTSGEYQILWAKLDVAGITHMGVGQARHDEPYGPAGLMSLALNNAALSFGCGIDVRLAYKRKRVFQDLTPAHEVSPRELEPLPEAPKPVNPDWAVTAIALGKTMQMSTIKEWAALHAPTVKGRSVQRSRSSALIAIASELNLDIELVAELISTKTPPPGEEEE